MHVCGVPGCDSHSDESNSYTFHRLPYSPVRRARWLIALGRSLSAADHSLHVCSRHFCEDCFGKRLGSKVLQKNAVPTLFMPPKTEQQYTPSVASLARHLSFNNLGFLLKKMKEESLALDRQYRLKELAKKRKLEASRALLVCRTCLSVDVALYEIENSNFKEFTELTGVPISLEDGLPHWLCKPCCRHLSNFGAFRERCQKSHSLLQTLRKNDTLTIDDIKSIDRDSNELNDSDSFPWPETFYSQIQPVVEITPLLTTEDDLISQYEVDGVAEFTEVEYTEIDECVENYINDLTIDDVKSIDRESNQLSDNSTWLERHCAQFQPIVEGTPVVKTEDVLISQYEVDGVAEFAEVEYAEVDERVEIEIKAVQADKVVKVECENDESSERRHKNDNSDINVYSSEEIIKSGQKTNREKVKIEPEMVIKSEIEEVNDNIDKTDIDTDTSEQIIKVVNKSKNKNVKYEPKSDTDDDEDYEYESIDNSDIDVDASEETIEFGKKIKKKKVKFEPENVNPSNTKNSDNTVHHSPSKRKRIGDDVYPQFNYKAFEKEFNVKITFLSKEEQIQEIEERKRKNTSKFRCDLCGKGYKCEKTLKNHLVYHDPSSGAHECDVCRVRFRRRCEMLRHQDLHRFTFSCQACQHSTRTKSAAKTHCQVHSGVTYACPHCEQVFSHKTTYYGHMRVVHPAGKIACDECGEIFLSEKGVRMHKRKAHKTSLKPKPEFKCSVCEVAFSSSAALDRHTSVSAGVSHAALWPCGTCGDSCGSEAARAAHYEELHPPDQYRCDECNKTFSDGASFATHARRTHEGRRATASVRPRGLGPSGPFVCDQCGRVTENEAKLRYHMYTHMKQKPFACPLCPKTFATKGTQECHMRTHTGEKPFQCAHCPMSFSQQNNLTRHTQAVHLNRRSSFPCHLCDKTFTTRSCVKVHIRTVHGGEPYPKRERKARTRTTTADSTE